MEIVKQRSGDLLDVRVTGRLDNHWSISFDEALTDIIREGAVHLRLDLTGVDYLSSAGIGVLIKAHQEVGKLQGSFIISAASNRVRSVLQMVKLESLLFSLGVAQATVAPVAVPPRRIASESVVIECYDLGGSRSECRLVGSPAALSRGVYAPADANSILARDKTFALGLGAFGRSFDECSTQFGEFLAATGSAAFMPTDGTSTPDYMVSSGELVPEIQALYGIEFRGSPCHLLRFESSTPDGAVPLSEIVRACASVADAPAFGIAMSAEVSGLVCAVLRRPPVQSASSRFDFPAIREWLSFAPEREHARTSSLVVGVVSGALSDGLLPFVRPVADGLQGHFHAAVTAFRSLPRGKLSVNEVIAGVFQPRSVISVVHLLRDNRPIEGVGESLFQRGACWVFPIGAVRDGGAA